MRAPLRNTALAALLALHTASVFAAQWKIDPTLALRAGYDDNIRMNVDDEISSAVVTFSPRALFSVETPRSGLSGDLRLDFRRYEDDSDLDDDNVRLLIDSFHTLERAELGLDLDLIRDTTLDSQLDNTGLVFDRVTRHTIDISPNLTYSLNERTSVGANYQYRDVQYKNAGGTIFTDFDVNVAEASLQRIVNERTTASTTLSYSRSDNDSGVESTNINLQGGASYQFSETLSASLFAGVRRTETDVPQSTQVLAIVNGNLVLVPVTTGSATNSDWGYTFSATLTRTFLRGEIMLSGSRNISSDVNGLPFEVTRLGWNNRYNFSETLSADLDLQLYQSDSDGSQSGSSLNREYYTVEPKFNWDFKKFWRISGSYRYRKQTFDNTNDEATQNAAYLTLEYRWPRIAVSR